MRFKIICINSNNKMFSCHISKITTHINVYFKINYKNVIDYKFVSMQFTVSISHHSLSQMTWLHACIHCMHMIIFLTTIGFNHPATQSLSSSSRRVGFNIITLVTLYLLIDPHIHDELDNTSSVSAIARLDLKLCIMDLMLILWKIIYM